MQLVVESPRALREGDELGDPRELGRLLRRIGEAVHELARERRRVGPEHGDEPPGEQGVDDLRAMLLRRRLGRRRVESRLLAEDRGVQLLQLRPRLDAELCEQDAARLLVDGECVRLPARPVEREHLERARPLAQRVRGGKSLQLGNDLGRPSAVELGLEAVLEGVHAELLEPALLPDRPGLELEVDVGAAAPERECLAELSCARLRLERARLGDEPLEAGGVQRLRVDRQEVAGRPGHEHVRPEQLAQRRDRSLQRRHRRLRRLVAPELLDELRRRDDLVRVQEQRGEEAALAAPGGQADRCSVRACRLERAEHAELGHTVTFVAFAACSPP